MWLQGFGGSSGSYSGSSGQAYGGNANWGGYGTGPGYNPQDDVRLVGDVMGCHGSRALYASSSSWPLLFIGLSAHALAMHIWRWLRGHSEEVGQELLGAGDPQLVARSHA